MLENKQQLRIKGTFHMKVFEGDVLKHAVTRKNLVVDTGLDIITKLLSNDGAGKYISKIGFGTDGTTPVSGNTTLTSSLVKALGSFSYPEIGKVEYDWSLETSEGNGKVIEEFGLLGNDSTLFARIVHAPITKVNTMRLVGTWSMKFETL